MTSRRTASASVAHPSAGERVLAWILDAVVAYVFAELIHEQVTALLGVVGYGAAGITGSPDDAYTWVQRHYLVNTLIFAGASLLLVGAFFVSFLRVLKASPGQRLVGLLSVESESGSRLATSAAILRFAAVLGPLTVVAATPPPISLYPDPLGRVDWTALVSVAVRVGAAAWYLFLVISVLRSPNGRGFHDLATRSAVVRRI